MTFLPSSKHSGPNVRTFSRYPFVSGIKPRSLISARSLFLMSRCSNTDSSGRLYAVLESDVRVCFMVQLLETFPMPPSSNLLSGVETYTIVWDCAFAATTISSSVFFAEVWVPMVHPPEPSTASDILTSYLGGRESVGVYSYVSPSEVELERGSTSSRGISFTTTSSITLVATVLYFWSVLEVSIHTVVFTIPDSGFSGSIGTPSRALTLNARLTLFQFDSRMTKFSGFTLNLFACS